MLCHHVAIIHVITRSCYHLCMAASGAYQRVERESEGGNSNDAIANKSSKFNIFGPLFSKIHSALRVNLHLQPST